MFALGLGSFISRYISKNLFQSLIKIELTIGVIGGFSSLVLFLSNLYLESYELVMYMEILIIGTLAGAEIPILTRIIEEDEHNLKLTLSSIFSFDYIGGLIGSIAFPLLLLPTLGYFSTAFLCGTLNIMAAIIIIFKYNSHIINAKFYKFVSICIICLMFLGMIFSENISKVIEDGLYRDRVILSEQTPYQKIVMTRYLDDVRLFIDGNLQFSTSDEYRYHESLIHIPMSQVKNKNNVLILGGGDGMALREVLKYGVKSVDLVDLDEQMVELCSTHPLITKINGGSLKNEKLKLHFLDAFEFLENKVKNIKTDKQTYDLIVVDLPDPNSDALNKLYSNIFYRMCSNVLSDDGVLVVQSTSPYFATKAFWCINKTIRSEIKYTKAYHVEVPSFGDWGFNMAKKSEFSDDYNIDIETKFLTSEKIPDLFNFAKDEVDENVMINNITKPILIEYYNRAVRQWR